MNYNQWIATVNYPVEITMEMIQRYDDKLSIQDFVSMDRQSQKELLICVADWYFETSTISPVIGEITTLLNGY